MLADLLSRGFRRNQRVIRLHADGIDHGLSLTQTEYNVNCFNWVVGHIVNSRSDILDVLDSERVTTGEELVRYRRESDPIEEDGPGVMSFDELLELLDRTEEALEAALGAADAEFLAAETPVDGGRTASRAAQIMFGYFHDTYHAGQTDLLRQLSGMSDKVI